LLKVSFEFQNFANGKTLSTALSMNSKQKAD
jgi:hypothetical protein